MKGALVVCRGSVDLLAVLADVADQSTQLEATAYDGSTQLMDERGRRLTAFADPVPPDEWEPERQAVAERVVVAHPEELSAHEVECRWEDLFCCVIRAAAKIACLVVVDGNGEVHLAAEVEPDSIQL